MKQKELTYYLNSTSYYLVDLIGRIDSCYKEYIIPKKNGGKRIIHAPNEELKKVQHRLSLLFTEHYEKQINFSIVGGTGTKQKTNIVSNAKIHQGKEHILSLDIKDFYPSITVELLNLVFTHQFKWMSKRHRLMLLNLLTYKGRLPQGAPTSPILGNIVFAHCDIGLIKFAEKNNLNYSRYVDDLTFSSDLYIQESLIEDIAAIIGNNGFRLNPKKTRFTSNKRRQLVTGLVVNEKVNIKQSDYKQMRAIINCLKIEGLSQSYKKTMKTAKEPTKEQLDWYLQVIQGGLAHFKMVLGSKNPRYTRLKSEFDILLTGATPS